MPLASGAEMLWPRTEAFEVAGTMIENDFFDRAVMVTDTSGIDAGELLYTMKDVFEQRVNALPMDHHLTTGTISTNS
jgi:hypothetical protein